MKDGSLVLASIGTALGATLCCIGPLAAVVTGVGSLAAVTAFEPLRPYLIGVAFVLFGATVYVRRGRAMTECADGSCLPVAGRSLSLWLLAGIILVLLAFPYYVEPLSRVVLGVF